MRRQRATVTPQRPDPAAAGSGWQLGAACRGADPDWFFPSSDGEAVRALSVCARCEVRLRCLAFALARGERFGVWGGMTERERAALADRDRRRIIEVARDRAA